eukprot:8932845-Pyramimonas_sp.AAC.1
MCIRDRVIPNQNRNSSRHSKPRVLAFSPARSQLLFRSETFASRSRCPSSLRSCASAMCAELALMTCGPVPARTVHGENVEPALERRTLYLDRNIVLRDWR